MKYADIIKKVSEELNLPKEVVNKTYKAYWYYIYNIISNHPLKDELNKDDFNKLRCNINIPSLGKLYIDWGRYIAIKNKYNLKNAKDK